MKRQAGFTLIEVLATSAIASILAGALGSIIHLCNVHIIDGNANIALSRGQIVASEQIRRDGRNSYGVKKAGEDNTAITSANTDPVQVGLSEIRFTEHDGDTLAAYRIANGRLEEYGETSPGVREFKPFCVGSDTVWLDAVNSDFKILPCRRGAVFNLRYKLVVGATTYTLPPLSETILCRNRYN